MKSTIIPAQITTVEDKIAGNLSMTQIIILMMPVFFGTLLFALIPPTMKVSVYKIPPAILVVVVSSLLALRVRGKVVLQWIQILFAYNMRPRYYVCNKNDIYLRDISVIKIEEKREERKELTKKQIAIAASEFTLRDLKNLEPFIKNPRYSFSLKTKKNGRIQILVSEANPY